MEHITSIGMIVGYIFFCGGIFLLVASRGYSRQDARREHNIIVPCCIILGGFIIALCISINIASSMKNQLVKSQIEATPYEYTFYIDGTEIDYNKIDIEQYDMSYNMEKHEVYLTRKSEEQTVFLPFYIFR